ncbi:MAG: RDD family protein [Leptospiraceae bacterium]|nr:RDD family protein [Leptospiraceae bacterium]MDW8306185.1 RDD family protein [Leptospiraceae bacterium]
MRKKRKETSTQTTDIVKAAELESEFMLKAEAGEIIPDETYLQKLHLDELLEIKDLVNPEREAELAKRIESTILRYEEPRIEIARLDERIWSYFYEKYLLRFLFLIWGGLVFLLVPNKTEPEEGMPMALKVFLLGALVLIIAFRLSLAIFESQKKASIPASPLRRKLGIAVFMQDGNPPGFFRALLRGFFKSFPLMFLTVLTMELSPNNRGIHDKLFGTYVLRINNPNVSRAEIREFIKTKYASKSKTMLL